MKKLIAILAAIFLFAIMSCSDGSGGGNDDTTSESINNSSAVTDNPNYEISATIDSQGGTISVNDAKSPINGLIMVIPANALNNATKITIRPIDKTIPLPQGLNITENVIELLPSGQIFNNLISITVPYSGETPPSIITYNAENNTYSILPATSIDAENKTITVMTNHFCDMIEVDVDSSFSFPSISTTFSLTEDTFKINNQREDFLNVIKAYPDKDKGFCWGFAYYTKWYFENKKTTDGNLHDKYDKNLEEWLVSDAHDSQTENISQFNNFLALGNIYSIFDIVTFKSLYIAMYKNKTPQVLNMANYQIFNMPRHSVLVYAITKISDSRWRLDIYDSTDNSKSYPLYFDNGKFEDWQGGSINNTTYDWFSFNGDNAVDVKSTLENVYNKYKYTVSGKVTLNGYGMSNVTINIVSDDYASLTTSITTDINGVYSFKNLPNKTYQITPLEFNNYLFSPTSASVTIINANVTGQDFTGRSSTTTKPGSWSEVMPY